MEPRVNCKLISFLVFCLLLSLPAAQTLAMNSSGDTSPSGVTEPFHITLFIPSPNMIHSDQVLNQINTPDGGVLFGTTFGLSLFKGTWSTRHINRDNISAGLMDEYITAIECDHNGNLWIRYSGGIQIYNGVSYQTLRDQELFKDPQIQDLQRWHNDMWVATGNSGIHRYRDGAWTWFQPMTKNGPGFYEVRGMTLDPASDSLIIVTEDNGIWMVRSPDDPVTFEQIATKDGSYTSQEQARREPLGGVYFFNDTAVIHYTPGKGFIPLLRDQDLYLAENAINDLAAAPDGRIFLATDRGIFIWKDHAMYRQLGRFEGIGTSEIVRTIFIDSKNRVWFSTKDNVSYYQENTAQNPIQILVVTPATAQPVTTVPSVPVPVPTVLHTQEGSQPEPAQNGLSPILDPILRALHAILSRIGPS